MDTVSPIPHTQCVSPIIGDSPGNAASSATGAPPNEKSAAPQFTLETTVLPVTVAGRTSGSNCVDPPTQQRGGCRGEGHGRRPASRDGRRARRRASIRGDPCGAGVGASSGCRPDADVAEVVVRAPRCALPSALRRRGSPVVAEVAEVARERRRHRRTARRPSRSGPTFRCADGRRSEGRAAPRGGRWCAVQDTARGCRNDTGRGVGDQPAMRLRSTKAQQRQ